MVFGMSSNRVINQRCPFLCGSRVSSMYDFVLIYRAFPYEMAFEALSIL